MVADDKSGGAVLVSASLARDRAGRGAPARRPSARNRLGGWYGRVPDDPSMLVAADSRDVARNAARTDSDYAAASSAPMPSCLTCRPRPVASGAGDLDRAEIGAAGSSTCYTAAAARALRTDWQPGGTAPVAGLLPQHGNHVPALTALDSQSTRRPRRAHRCSCRPADPAALAIYRRRPPFAERRQSNMRPCRNTVIQIVQLAHGRWLPGEPVQRTAIPLLPQRYRARVEPFDRQGRR